jgi:hypothetical protein
VETLEAATMGADRGVRIYVVGLGTAEGYTRWATAWRCACNSQLEASR